MPSARRRLSYAPSGPDLTEQSKSPAVTVCYCMCILNFFNRGEGLGIKLICKNHSADHYWPKEASVPPHQGANEEASQASWPW